MDWRLLLSSSVGLFAYWCELCLSKYQEFHAADSIVTQLYGICRTSIPATRSQSRTSPSYARETAGTVRSDGLVSRSSHVLVRMDELPFDPLDQPYFGCCHVGRWRFGDV